VEATCLAELGQLFREHPEPCKWNASHEHQTQRGRDSANAAFIEVQETEAPMICFLKNQRGDQVSADDEEDINTHITARKSGQASVKQDHRNNRNGAQTIDFWPVLHRNGCLC